MKRIIAVVVGVLVIYAAWHLSQPDPPPSSGGQTSRPTRAAADAAAPSSTSAMPASPPWVNIGEDAPTKAGYWAQISDPTRSDLPVPLASEASAMGAALVRADVTGDGRDAFYGYWGVGRAQPCCRNVVIHAAGASSTTTSGVVQVAVIWSAERLDGQLVTEETTVVFLAHRGTIWVPLHSWELTA